MDDKPASSFHRTLSISSLRKQLPSAASIVVGLLPIFILIPFFGVSRKIIAKGAIAYALGAVGFKLPLYHLFVVRVLHKRLSHRFLAIAQGAVSAFSELGAALCFFLFVVPEMTFAELVGFGVASGSLEAIILPFMKNPLEGTPLEDHARETGSTITESSRLEWFGVLERFLASIVHTATRGLVYVSTVTGNPIPAALAILGFASIDGRAYFAHLEKWRFDDSRVLGRFYRFLAGVALALAVLFLLLYYLLM